MSVNGSSQRSTKEYWEDFDIDFIRAKIPAKKYMKDTLSALQTYQRDVRLILDYFEKYHSQSLEETERAQKLQLLFADVDKQCWVYKLRLKNYEGYYPAQLTRLLSHAKDHLHAIENAITDMMSCEKNQDRYHLETIAMQTSIAACDLEEDFKQLKKEPEKFGFFEPFIMSLSNWLAYTLHAVMEGVNRMKAHWDKDRAQDIKGQEKDFKQEWHKQSKLKQQVFEKSKSVTHLFHRKSQSFSSRLERSALNTYPDRFQVQGASAHELAKKIRRSSCFKGG